MPHDKVLAAAPGQNETKRGKKGKKLSTVDMLMLLAFADPMILKMHTGLILIIV